jgi:hypothetical protein
MEMVKQGFRSVLRTSVFFAAVIAATPALWAQSSRAVAPGSVEYNALPAALAPVASSAKAVKAAYSARGATDFSAIHIPDTDSSKPVRQMAAESLPSRRNWMILSAFSSGAAALDAYSTRRSIAAGNVEADPIMKPFANSPAIYVATQISPVVMDFVGYKMQHSHNFVLRKMWWMPQTGGTAMSLFAGVHNLQIAGK